MGHTVVVTHTDLDGVASAAVYLRIAGLSPDDASIVYAEPYNLNEKLRDYVDYLEEGDAVAIMDLGVNTAIFNEVRGIVGSLTSKRVRVEWYDHHVWPADARETLAGLGVRLFIDRSTCATGVVARYAPKVYGRTEDVSEIVEAVCAADLWLWTHPLAPKLFRVLGRRDDEEWKGRLLRKLYSNILWDEELEHKLQEYVDLELRGYERVLKTLYVARDSGCSVAAVYKPEGPPPSSMIGSTLLSRYDADIAVIVRSNGAVSLRSRRVDVSVVASRLGGGGHPAAAGARLELPLYVRLLAPLYPKLLSRHAARLIARTAREAARCGQP